MRAIANDSTHFDKKVVLITDDEEFVAFQHEGFDTPIFHRKVDLGNLSKERSREYRSLSYADIAVLKSRFDHKPAVERYADQALTDDRSEDDAAIRISSVGLHIEAFELGLGMLVFFGACVGLGVLYGTALVHPVVAGIGVVFGLTYTAMGIVNNRRSSRATE